MASDTKDFADVLLQCKTGPFGRKPVKLSALQAVEEEYINIRSDSLSSLLPRLQQHWRYDVSLKDVFQLPNTVTKRSIKFNRQGLSGTITGYSETVENVGKLRPETSSSFKRAPASKHAFVRGKGSYFPFLPGGVDVDKSRDPAGLDSNIDLDVDNKGLFTRAPGLPKVTLPVSSATTTFTTNPAEWDLPQLDQEFKPRSSQEAVTTNGLKVANTVSEADEFLPQEFAMVQQKSGLQPRAVQPKDKKWAQMVDVNRDMSNFAELVPDLAFKHPFELDTFQKEAVYHLEQSESVFVAAHTSAGKTVVAEYAIALAAKHMTRAIYTSPIKALSNQKYRDFRQTFDSVGILTGDVQLNPEASCLIMTTEILRSMLYRGADLIRDVEFVIFDEVHYVNDQERGVVWEEVIIMLPEHITLIMLSATVPNTLEFANWVGRTKQKDIYVISTLKRPVPLEHHLYANKKLFKIVDANKQWLAAGYKDASQALVRNKEAKPVVAPTGRGRGANRGSGQRGGPPGRGRGQAQPFVRGGMMKTMERHDKNIWIHLVGHLKERKLLPSVIFVFSKKRCEDNASVLSNIDLTNAVEKSQIHVTIEKALSRLKIEDRTLPQIVRMRELLSRGIAVHHGGLLPIVKEMVEILFSRTLVKVLFATETFAMGVNMPAKSVVFSGIRKHDGHAFRDLTPGEYTQMAGRAGRRGLDPTGTVIIVCGDEAPEPAMLTTMLMGQPFKLLSQFRLTYNMILNLLRVETLKIEEMIRRSFSENASQTLLPEQQKVVTNTAVKLQEVRDKYAKSLDEDVKRCHAICTRYIDESHDLITRAFEVAGKKYFGPGRLVILQTDCISRSVAIILGEGSTSTAQQRTVSVLLCKPEVAGRRASDLLPFLPPYKQFMRQDLSQGKFSLEILPITSIDVVTVSILKIDPVAIRRRVKSEWESVRSQLESMKSVHDDAYLEVDWDKVKTIELRDAIVEVKQLATQAQSTHAEDIPNFVQLYAHRHEEYLLEQRLLDLKHQISNQNLELLPDYEQRISVLHDLGFIDATHAVTLKGRVACEINSAHELILSELILENALSEFTCEEIVAMLSAFVFEERSDSVPTLTTKLMHGRDVVIAMARRVNAVQEQHQVLTAGSGDEFEDSPRFGLMEVCYEWARGMSFASITELTDVLEGTIVRCIVRLDEVLRECQSAARTVGDTAMYTKLETCRELIKRDVVFSASLFW